MGKSIITGLTTVILLISLLLIGIVVGSVISNNTLLSTKNHNYNQMVDEAFDEISTYILIKDQNGKFSEFNGEKRIDKIALGISPLFTKDIKMSQMTIKIINKDTIIILIYDGYAENLESYSVFDHPIWDHLNGNNFGFISIVDLDKSIVNYDSFNDCSDNAYVVFKLPDDMALGKNEKISVTLFPSTGITRTTILKAPLPINSVITFE